MKSMKKIEIQQIFIQIITITIKPA